jgi:integrase
MTTTAQLDAAGRRRSPATLPGYHSGRAPRNKGRKYPADPPRVEEIVAVMRAAGERPTGLRLRGLIVVLWRAGLRVSEALALAEGDLEPGRGAMLVRPREGRQAARGRHGRVGMAPPRALAEAQAAFAGRRPFLRAQRAYRRSGVVGRRGANAAPDAREAGWCSPSLRPPPATPRPRSRDGARRRAAKRHPAPAGPRGPRDYLYLPPGHRQWGDCGCSPRSTCVCHSSRCGTGSVGRMAGLAGPCTQQ